MQYCSWPIGSVEVLLSVRCSVLREMSQSVLGSCENDSRKEAGDVLLSVG